MFVKLISNNGYTYHYSGTDLSQYWFIYLSIPFSIPQNFFTPNSQIF